MPFDELKARSFRESAVAQGYAPKAIDAFIAGKRRIGKQEAEQFETAVGAVESGFPLTSVKSPEMQMRIFSEIGKRRGGLEPIETSRLMETPAERKLRAGSEQEAKNFIQLASAPSGVKRGEYMDLSEGAKAILREQYQYAPPAPGAEEVQAEERKAGRKIKSLERDIDVLEKNFDAVTGKGPLGSGAAVKWLSEKTGGLIEPDAITFEGLRSALLSPVARILSGETGPMNEGDIMRAEGMLPKITDSAGVVSRKMANIRTLIEGHKTDLGIGEERARPGFAPLMEEGIRGIEGVPTVRAEEGLPTIPGGPSIEETPTLPPEAPVGEMAGDLAGRTIDWTYKTAQKAGAVFDKVADFFYPENTQLIKDAVEQFKTGEGLPSMGPKEAMLAGVVPGAVAFRKDQVGRAAREAGACVVINFAMGWLFKKFLTPVYNKVTGPVKKMWKAMFKADPATRSFVSSFTVPTKRALALKPVQTSKKMVEYGVHGSLDDLAGVASKVTGRQGVVTKFTRDVLGKTRGEVMLDDVITGASGMIDTSLEIDKKLGNKIIRQIAWKTPTGKLIYRANPLDAFDLAKKVQTKAMQHYLVGHNYLTPNLKHQEIAKIYFAASDEILSAIEKSVRKMPAGRMAAMKTPELMNGLRQIGNGTFADDFLKATTFRGLRGIQSPFVKLSQMVELTQQAAQSAAMRMTSGAGTRLASTIGGFHLANLPGAAAGWITAPFLEAATRTSRAPIMTGAAQVLKRVGETGLPKIPPALGRGVGRMVETGLKGIGQVGRALIQKQMKGKGGGGLPPIGTASAINNQLMRPWQWK